MRPITMGFFRTSLFFLVVSACLFSGCNNPKERVDSDSKRGIWTAEEANTWYARQGWLVGPNYTPATAINQLEMWQEETFDPETIDKELGWAEGLGMNTARVYLHDLAYQQDSARFIDRIDHFLRLADKHGIRPLFVFFDSCWDPFPVSGKQRAPKPHVHNSGWVQSPGQHALKDSAQYPRLERYVKGIVSHFANDERILGWDVWNEPDNMTGPSYEAVEIKDKVSYVLPLLEQVFEWARSADPSQPLTSGVWAGDWSSDSTLKPIERLQIEQSDVISFHNYDTPEDFEKRIQQLQRYGKPLLCTEYMARPNGSTFAGFLPIAKKYNVAMINWGFVDGKTQTIYPWDSWTKTYTAEPPLWFHDIFRRDGTPYKQEEVQLIKQLLTNR
ncbi:Cellulase (glycosyl hydrolase family 5) [Parapedobacter indicus]|uniref:Cellulase (Glycosyl hydrolase family 5) n=2 Tax=Parapedobacter indicus TaxID=1477437 RepID=A0A1I3NEC7_9SPHI|nr:cellulase (glycosyl hydrolase family 5) [Parapedobacter indicus]SFJ07447.1 Cellulase (glycosyl hydrolase family 5) [Parapedobacter indicus]